MWSSQAARLILIGFGALLLVALLLRGGEMGAAGGSNAVALAAASGCARGTPPGQPIDGDFRRAWLESRQLHCAGDEPAAINGLNAVVAGPDYRLAMTRLAAPTDLGLAQAAVAAHGDLAVAHLWLADALKAAGQADEALAEYRKGLEITPTDGDSWEEVGLLYEARGEQLQAAQAYDEACQYVDRGKQGCLRAGRLYMKLQMYEQAALRFQDSIDQFAQTFVPAERGLVDALLALGRTDEAIPHLRILAANGDKDAQETLKKLQAQGK